ncbi:MAG TPA: exo-alpha-sialidase [Flavobacteriia bacterium]|nr:exo-alpha-sialidase [Flavobacteriia bacterium]
MKKIIYIVFLLLLFSCKTNNKTVKSNSNKPIKWQKLGPNTTYEDTLNKFSKSTETYWFGNGQIASLWADPNDADHLLAGVAFAGLFETNNNGENWYLITPNTPTISIKKILKKDGILYISTGYRFKNPLRFSAIKYNFYGYGVLQSSDNGKTWSKPSGNFYCADFSMEKSHQIAFAVDYKNIYKSEDSLKYFTKLFSFKDKIPDKGELINVVVNPNNNSLVYVSSAFGNSKNDATLFFSSDGGKTFSNKTSVIDDFAPKAISELGKYVKDVSLFYDEEEAILYAHFSVAYRFLGSNQKEYHKVTSVILKSKDFKNFTLETIQAKKNGFHFIPFIQKIDSTLFIKDWYLKMKNPSEKVFKDIGQGKTHQDTRAVAKTKNGTIFYGNDAGLFKSEDNGHSWQDAFVHLNANLIMEAGYYSDKEKRRIAFGTQDDGFYVNDFNGKSRYPIATHEGGIYQSKHDIDRIYVKDRQVKITTDGGKKFRTIKMNNGKPLGIMHNDGLLREDPVDKTKLYASHYDGLYVSDSLGVQGTWKNITPKNKLNGRGSCLAIPESNTNILYYANEWINIPYKDAKYDAYQYKAHLLKSTDSGATWKDIGKPFSAIFDDQSIISTVITDDSNPDNVWFTLRNLIDNKKVYFSDNGGVTWQNITYNLPNVPANRIVYDAVNKQLLLGNDLGVYILKSEKWIPFGEGLPKIIVTSMFVDNQHNKLIISTFGQGIWQIALKN